MQASKLCARVVVEQNAHHTDALAQVRHLPGLSACPGRCFDLLRAGGFDSAMHSRRIGLHTLCVSVRQMRGVDVLAYKALVLRQRDVIVGRLGHTGGTRRRGGVECLVL